jgi:hypothetical protein
MVRLMCSTYCVPFPTSLVSYPSLPITHSLLTPSTLRMASHNRPHCPLHTRTRPVEQPTFNPSFASCYLPIDGSPPLTPPTPFTFPLANVTPSQSPFPSSTPPLHSTAHDCSTSACHLAGASPSHLQTLLPTTLALHPAYLLSLAPALTPLATRAAVAT